MPSRLLTRQHVCVVCALLLGSGLMPAAQSRPPAAQARRPAAPPSAPANPAARALNLGHYDEVERLLRDRTDPNSVALRARAMIARGRYAEAEKLLAPVAASAPTNDAALELGLLQQYVGRRADARRTFERLISQLRATTADDYFRLARAEYAVEEFRDANDAFRAANKLAPDDAAINEAWGEFFYQKGEYGEAQKSFDLAVKSDPENVPAMIGLARL